MRAIPSGEGPERFPPKTADLEKRLGLGLEEEEREGRGGRGPARSLDVALVAPLKLAQPNGLCRVNKIRSRLKLKYY